VLFEFYLIELPIPTNTIDNKTLRIPEMMVFNVFFEHLSIPLKPNSKVGY